MRGLFKYFTLADICHNLKEYKEARIVGTFLGLAVSKSFDTEQKIEEIIQSTFN